MMRSLLMLIALMAFDVASFQLPGRLCRQGTLQATTDGEEAIDSLQSSLDRVDAILQQQDGGDSEMSFLVSKDKMTRPRGEQLANLAIVTLGAYAVTTGVGSLLIDYEWFQTWRYFWPMVGGLYIADGLLVVDVLPFPLPNKATKVMSVIFGVGLVIGGAYDAFMPVWETGPNIVTQAGIGQDSATVLLVLSIVSILLRKDTTNEQKGDDNVSQLLQMLLLGQLYTLADGSIEELVERLSTALPL